MSKIKPLQLRYRSIKKQNGLALILFVFLISLAITGITIKFLSAGNIQTQLDVRSVNSLVTAKEAVVGNVLTGQSGTSIGQFPCAEDTSLIGFSTEGQAKGNCSNTVSSTGRFAWRTIGTGDLRDGNNDKLWYALSEGFRAIPVNSDTVGKLSIDGLQNQAIAILFSPGVALSSQARTTPSAINAPIISDYLETENNDGDNDFITGISESSFNDKLLAIKADDIYPLMEKRVLGEIKNYLLAYLGIWGAYPFPAPFSNPTTATYIGSNTLIGGLQPTFGLLPIGDAGVSWSGANGSSVRASNGVSQPAACVLSGTMVTCTISKQNYSGSRSLIITATLNNVGFGFYKSMDLISTSDFQFTPSTLKNTSILSYSLDASGGGAVKLTATPTSNTSSYTIVFKRPPQFDDWNSTTLIPNYIYKNKWHELIYYKVASPYLPGGTNICGASCLTVNRLDVTPNLVSTTNHALLMCSGRKLEITQARPSPTYNSANPAQNRPSSALADYFDSSNNISALSGTVFDSTRHPLPTFNDQIEVIE